MNAKPFVLRFDSGTLVLDGASASDAVPGALRWDERVLRWRAPAHHYRHVVKELTARGTLFEDRARAYDRFDFRTKLAAEPRPYQDEAIAEWERAHSCGVVVLPTGAGKSLVAQMAIERAGRSDQIDLMPVAHAGLFQVGPENAVDQADRRKVLHAGEPEAGQPSQERFAQHERIGPVDSGQHGVWCTTGSTSSAISATISLALPYASMPASEPRPAIRYRPEL